MQESEFTGRMNKVQGKERRSREFLPQTSKSKRTKSSLGTKPRAAAKILFCGYVDAFHRFLYDELLGRLAQRLERSVYTRKVVRSNRTVPTIVTQHPSAGT